MIQLQHLVISTAHLAGENLTGTTEPLPCTGLGSGRSSFVQISRDTDHETIII